MTDFPTRIRLDEIYPAETNRGRRLLEASGRCSSPASSASSCGSVACGSRRCSREGHALADVPAHRPVRRHRLAAGRVDVQMTCKSCGGDVVRLFVGEVPVYRHAVRGVDHHPIPTEAPTPRSGSHLDDPSSISASQSRSPVNPVMRSQPMGAGGIAIRATGGLTEQRGRTR